MQKISDTDSYPLVSIKCLVYNHEPYLRQCLDGFVMQKTNFAYEVIVHDDASTDNSANIIKEYAKKYPNIIKPIFESHNQFSEKNGSVGRIMNAALHPRAKYIAICEGDDYWTDPNKLQIQVDFLEKNKDYAFCCHRFKIYDEIKGVYIKEYAYHYYKNADLEISKSLFFKVWVTQALTVVCRKELYLEAFASAKDFNYFRDVHIFYLLLNKGKAISINRFMGVYRWHNKGIASIIPINTKRKNMFLVYNELYRHFQGDKYLESKYFHTLVRLIQFSNIREKKLIFDENSDLIQQFYISRKLTVLFSLIIPKTLFQLLYQLKSLVNK